MVEKAITFVDRTKQDSYEISNEKDCTYPFRVTLDLQPERDGEKRPRGAGHDKTAGGGRLGPSRQYEFRRQR